MKAFYFTFIVVSSITIFPPIVYLHFSAYEICKTHNSSIHSDEKAQVDWWSPKKWKARQTCEQTNTNITVNVYLDNSKRKNFL